VPHAVDGTTETRGIGQAEARDPDADRDVALCVNRCVDVRSLTLEEVGQCMTVPHLDAPKLSALDCRLGQETVGDQETGVTLVSLYAVDELPHSIQVDRGGPALRLNCRPRSVADRNDVGALVEAADVLDLLEADERKEFDDGGLELQAVQAIDSFKMGVGRERPR
jgi:hypothetical protein